MFERKRTNFLALTAAFVVVASVATIALLNTTTRSSARIEAMEYELVPIPASALRQRQMIRMVPPSSLQSWSDYNPSPLTSHDGLSKGFGIYDKPASEYNGPLSIHTAINGVKTAGMYDKPNSEYTGPLSIHTAINGVKTAGMYDKPNSEYTGPLTIHTAINGVQTAGTFDKPNSEYNGPLSIHTNINGVKTAGMYDKPSSEYSGPLTVFNGATAGAFSRPQGSWYY